MRRRHFLTTGITALALSAQAQAGAIIATPPQRREFVAPHMGTLWRLVFFENDPVKARDARDAAWSRLSDLNAKLSDYDANSELSTLARQGHLNSPSNDLRQVLTRSHEIATLTHGAFDITIGPLVQLWRSARKNQQLPGPADIETARRLVNWRAVELTATAAHFHTPGGRLDLGGIGKGFAQDQVLQLLREQYQLDAVLLDAGGGVSVGAPPPTAHAWSATVDTSSEEDAQVSLQLRHQSLATSGDTRQFIEINGQHYSHIVDPATGLGLTRRHQASVVAPDATTADALATAFCVMGEENARTLLSSRPDLAARIVSVLPSSRQRTWESASFARLARTP